MVDEEEMENTKWVSITVVGGILIAIGGLVGNVTFFSQIFELLLSLYPDENLATVLALVLQIFGYIAAGGGFSVIIGALLVGTRRFSLGKFVIGLGAGMGLIGLVVFLISALISGTLVGELMVVVLGLVGLNEGTGFVGILLTILARSRLRKPE